MHCRLAWSTANHKYNEAIDRFHVQYIGSPIFKVKSSAILML
jgi:hypothetical protein